MTWVWIALAVIVVLGLAVIVLAQPGAHRGRHRPPKRVVVTRAAEGGVLPVPPEDPTGTPPAGNREKDER